MTSEFDNKSSSKEVIKVQRYGPKMARKIAFSKFVAGVSCEITDGKKTWVCCDQHFNDIREVHHHIGATHNEDLKQFAQDIFNRKQEEHNSSHDTEAIDWNLPKTFDENDIFPWLPAVSESQNENGKGKVVLYYRYRDISNTDHVKNWQEELCRRLALTGKIRVATEGVNATASGTESAIETYIAAVKCHPLFSDMKSEDFKLSDSDPNVFHEGLKVGIFKEACPMGVDPNEVSFRNTGTRLTPEEWHSAMEKYINDPTHKQEAILIDCRNFYESKIGKFIDALAPDIRKFSYWPEYVEKNRKALENRKVYMYCTGGIRCERGSAYIKEKGITNKVYHLEGGIHKYMEKFPDGYFRGKLFVFDDRQTIQSNDDVLSACVYCGVAWDKYSKCSSGHCHQLVLTCDSCQQKGLTACCKKCAMTAQRQADAVKEECDCTRKRQRVAADLLEKAS